MIFAPRGFAQRFLLTLLFVYVTFFLLSRIVFVKEIIICMDFIKNSLIAIILLLIFLLFLASLNIGCVTVEPVKMPEGYLLVVDIEGKMRVVTPSGYITGPRWETVEVAVEYAKSYAEWGQ